MPDLSPVFGNYPHSQVNQIMNDTLCCTVCGAPSILLVAMCENIIKPRYLVACRECNHRGEFGKDLYDAVKRWNRNSSSGFFAHFMKKWLLK